MPGSSLEIFVWAEPISEESAYFRAEYGQTLQLPLLLEAGYALLDLAMSVYTTFLGSSPWF